jgi:Protein of unknown function (DUF2442)
MRMIKITSLSIAGDLALDLSFSDGTSACWHADDIIARDTEMTRPLMDPGYFARAFIEGGALAWPNGLEFSPEALRRKLDASGALRRKAA